MNNNITDFNKAKEEILNNLLNDVDKMLDNYPAADYARGIVRLNINNLGMNTLKIKYLKELLTNPMKANELGRQTAALYKDVQRLKGYDLE